MILSIKILLNKKNPRVLSPSQGLRRALEQQPDRPGQGVAHFFQYAYGKCLNANFSSRILDVTVSKLKKMFSVAEGLIIIAQQCYTPR